MPKYSRCIAVAVCVALPGGLLLAGVAAQEQPLPVPVQEEAAPVIVAPPVPVRAVPVEEQVVVEETQVDLLPPPPPPPPQRTTIDPEQVEAAKAECRRIFDGAIAQVKVDLPAPDFSDADARAQQRKDSFAADPNDPLIMEGLQGPVQRARLMARHQSAVHARNQAISATYTACEMSIRVPRNEDGSCPMGTYRPALEPEDVPGCMTSPLPPQPSVANMTTIMDQPETLKVAFRGGSPTMRRAIMRVAKDWERRVAVPGQVSGGLSFDFGTPLPWGFVYNEWTPEDTEFAGHIRIDFEAALGYWSLIGSDSYNRDYVGPHQASMNLGGMDGYSPLPRDWRKTVYHEFGHAIGLEHEHQHPDSDCNAAMMLEDEPGYSLTRDNKGRAIEDPQGRRPSAITIMQHYPNYWKEAEARLNYEQLIASSDYMTSDFDLKSIMRYTLPASFYQRGAPAECYSSEYDPVMPSALDIQTVRAAYSSNVLIRDDGGGGVPMASPEN